MQGFCIGDCFSGAAHVRFRDDFQQRRAGAVQIDARHALVIFMQRFAGVFFQVCARQLHGFQFSLAIALEHERHLAALDDRNFELADLVTLGQVRIKVVFARKHGMRRDHGVDGEAELDRALDSATVHHGQHARQGQVDRAGLRVRLGAETDRGTAENF